MAAKPRRHDPGNKLQIGSYLHCKDCVKELKATNFQESPREYAHLEVGFTEIGLQVW